MIQSLRECALSAFGRKAPANAPQYTADIIQAAALVEQELNAVQVSWCEVCGTGFYEGQQRYIVADSYGNRACVCMRVSCRSEVYAACEREGVTAVLA